LLIFARKGGKIEQKRTAQADQAVFTEDCVLVKVRRNFSESLIALSRGQLELNTSSFSKPEWAAKSSRAREEQRMWEMYNEREIAVKLIF